MRKSDVQDLVDHMYWVNHRLLEYAGQLSTDRFVDTSAGTTRDLRATLVHELDVEWSWRLNLEGRLSEAEEDLQPEQFPDLATLRARWQADEAEMRSWLDGLTDADLEAEVGSELSADRRSLWQYVIHIVMHAAQQQADAATLLTAAGLSPGEIGYLEFLKTTGR